MEITHNRSASRFEYRQGNETAVADYGLYGNRVVITHVEVPKKLENKGIGSQLVKAVLEDAKARNLHVVPQCPFAAKYIARHSEYRELVEA